MIHKSVCAKCFGNSEYVLTGRFYIVVNLRVECCTAMRSYNPAAIDTWDLNPPKWCGRKFEQAVAAGVESNNGK